MDRDGRLARAEGELLRSNAGHRMTGGGEPSRE
jgi:hypothetical protein